MTTAELSVWGVQDSKEYRCAMETNKTSDETHSFTCEVKNPPDVEFQLLLVNLSFILTRGTVYGETNIPIQSLRLT